MDSFDQGQTAPAFLEWQRAESRELARLVEETPGLSGLADPWTREGLTLIETAARTAWPHPVAELDAEERATRDRMARGVGACFLRAFGAGRWVWVQTWEHAPLGPALELPGVSIWVDTVNALDAAIVDAGEGELVRMLDGLLDAVEHWAAQGTTD